MNIIDAHCHIFPDKIAVKATQNTLKFYDIPHTAYYGDVGSLLKQCEESGVSRCVVSGVATNPQQPKKLNEFLKNEEKLHPDKFIALGSLHPESPTIPEDFKHLIDLGIKGVKIHPDIQGYKADCKGYMEIYELCDNAGIPILIHTGDSRYDNSNPNRMEKILKAYPHLQIIGAHLGGWSVWEEACEKLCKYDNFYVDTCSSFYLISHTNAKRIINKYGTDKVIFGTDYPMWKQKDEIERILSLGFCDEDLEKIFSKNILKVLNLK